MKLNLLIDVNEPLNKGPGRRARNLVTGLDRIGVPYEICGEDFEWAVAMQTAKFNARWHMLPIYTPVGPNVAHEAKAHTDMAAKFKNYLVQSEWVADLWRWADPELTKDFTFYVYPASVDLEDGYNDIASNRKPSVNCLFYTKYQSGENRELAESIYKKAGHSVVSITYEHYTLDQLKEACSKAEYCIYNSCCEKSSNAIMEIMACGLPVYVVDSKRWIGDDKFDRCTSAPHFSDACGVKGDFYGAGFGEFYDKVKAGRYDPHFFVRENHSAEKVATDLVEVVKKCHG